VIRYSPSNESPLTNTRQIQIYRFNKYAGIAVSIEQREHGLQRADLYVKMIRERNIGNRNGKSVFVYFSSTG